MSDDMSIVLVAVAAAIEVTPSLNFGQNREDSKHHYEYKYIFFGSFWIIISYLQ